jgi:hypothetical protein
MLGLTINVPGVYMGRYEVVLIKKGKLLFQLQHFLLFATEFLDLEYRSSFNKKARSGLMISDPEHWSVSISTGNKLGTDGNYYKWSYFLANLLYAKA